jgi:hypothetical protein
VHQTVNTDIAAVEEQLSLALEGLAFRSLLLLLGLGYQQAVFLLGGEEVAHDLTFDGRQQHRE